LIKKKNVSKGVLIGSLWESLLYGRRLGQRETAKRKTEKGEVGDDQRTLHPKLPLTIKKKKKTKKSPTFGMGADEKEHKEKGTGREAL